MEKTQNYIENPLGTKPIKKLLISSQINFLC